MKCQDTVAIFINEIYIGTYVEFQNYLSVKYNIIMSLWSLNYKQLVANDVQDYYNDKVNIEIHKFNTTLIKYLNK